MIRPVHFTFNAETAVNNAFQVSGKAEGAQEKALKEFDDMVSRLRRENIDIMVINDSPEPHTPDSIFPNNWISFHENGSICLYPMFADNRRQERKPAVLEAVQQRFEIRQTFDLTSLESENLFLEGTGSMVLDRTHRIAYAALSPRTHPEVLTSFCNQMNYQPVTFTATDKSGQLIYHSNVMMCVAENFVVICLDSIRDRKEKKELLRHFQETEKEVITISQKQMAQFAGNMLQVQTLNGDYRLIMSTRAFESLQDDQRKILEKYNPVIHVPLNTIEDNGGGSARCMMAEVFLPLKKITSA